MRVLHLIPTLLGGGAERQISLLLPAFKRMGLDSHLGFEINGPNLAALQNAGCSLHQLPRRAPWNPLRVIDLHRVITKVRPDVVQTWLTPMDLIGGGLARIAGIPHVLSERSSRLAYPPTLVNRLRGAVGRKAEKIIANSPGGVEYWLGLGAGDRTVEIRNAIAEIPPPAAIAAARENLVIVVGRLSYEKNVLTLIDALTLALQARPGAIARLLGAGPLEDAARARIGGYDMEGRILLDGYSNSLPDWYSRAALFVSASDFEGHPNAVIEAAAHSCPMVLSDIPAHRAAISEGAASFVDGCNSSAIAGAIVDALDNPEAAQRRAEIAYRDVGGLTVEAQAEQYRAIYESLTKSPSRPH